MEKMEILSINVTICEKWWLMVAHVWLIFWVHEPPYKYILCNKLEAKWHKWLIFFLYTSIFFIKEDVTPATNAEYERGKGDINTERGEGDQNMSHLCHF